MHRISKATSVFGLSRMNALLDFCGNPQNSLKTVHVAGTKGKGSTAAMLASILKESGLKTGLYTSPHLLDIRERIQINGYMIPEAEVVKHLNRLEPYLLKAGNGGGTYSPTFFETFTVIAFLHFLEQKCDISVIEVGLGGRLDATNVVTPEACGITPVSFDHMDKLGKRLWQIAGEKAGIVKQGIPVVSGVQQEEALQVIREKCKELAAPLKVVGEDVTISSSGKTFGVKTWKQTYDGLVVPLLGSHQRENAATAVALAEILREKGLAVSEAGIRSGIKNVDWPGRIQVIAHSPEIIIDGAHNEASARALTDTLASLPRRRTIFIVAIARDKDIAGIARTLAQSGDEFITTRTENPRAALPEDLAEAFKRESQKPVSSAVTPEKALELARSKADANTRICCTGSLYLVGELIRITAPSAPAKI